MTDHDAIYHRMFSHPGMVTQLLREFVAEPWLDDLDFDGMQRVNAKFHARSGERRDGDVVWRIPLRSGGDAYLLLMLEFQSTQDRWMALRVLVYAGSPRRAPTTWSRGACVSWTRRPSIRFCTDHRRG